MRREGDSVPDSAERCKKKAEAIDSVSCRKLPGEEEKKEEDSHPEPLQRFLSLLVNGREG